MAAARQSPPGASTATSSTTTEKTRFTSSLTLAAVPTAVSAARRYVRDELRRAGLAVLTDDAELVASELVTNAVRATGLVQADPTWPALEGVAVIRIRLGFNVASIFIEVWDRDRTFPALQQASDYEENGRGLLIVTSLCTRWNAQRARDGGKVVWAELPMPAPIKLPRRVPGRLY